MLLVMALKRGGQREHRTLQQSTARTDSIRCDASSSAARAGIEDRDVVRRIGRFVRRRGQRVAPGQQRDRRSRQANATAPRNVRRAI
jgi:hypothetical protein